MYVSGEDALYFTSVPRPGPRVDIKRLDLGSLTVSVLRPDACAANGMALGHDGRLVVCEQIGGAIAAVDPSSGERELLADGFNSPNDVVVKSDGTIWFTDPSYGWLQGFRPRPRLRDAVHCLDPRTGVVATVAESFDRTGDSHQLPEHPDGLKADADGRLYASFSGGVEVLSPDGSPIGAIRVPGAVNFCFGGRHKNVLFITTDTAIHAAHLQAKGL